MEPEVRAELKRFWDDGALRTAVEEYLYLHLDQLALNRVYKNEPTFGVADAKVVIENAFIELDDWFAPEKINKELDNEAR